MDTAIYNEYTKHMYTPVCNGFTRFNKLCKHMITCI